MPLGQYQGIPRADPGGRELPPWVKEIEIEEYDGQISPERNIELRPFTKHVQETSDEILLEQFHQYLLKRNADFAELGFYAPSSDFQVAYELHEFKSRVALARLLGPDCANKSIQVILYEFGEDSNGFEVGIGAPDLFLWAANDDSKFWFFSEVKAHGDYLNTSQKAWINQHWDLVRGHFLLTVLE